MHGERANLMAHLHIGKGFTPPATLVNYRGVGSNFEVERPLRGMNATYIVR